MVDKYLEVNCGRSEFVVWLAGFGLTSFNAGNVFSNIDHYYKIKGRQCVPVEGIRTFV